MKNAACKEIDFNNEPIRRCIKIDGAWQKRGNVLLNGYVSGIIADKCVDVEVLSKFCRGCKMWESRKGSLKYKTWKLSHSCSINHFKSSRSMETAHVYEPLVQYQTFDDFIKFDNLFFSCQYIAMCVAMRFKNT